VSILNPRAIVLSGQLAECDEILMSGIRERVYLRTMPLVTRDLIIGPSTLGQLAGVIGLARITIESLLGAEALDERLGSLPARAS
jgi:hypothetical protein